MARAPAKPTELAITLAALWPPYGVRDSWLCADEIRGGLLLLGFDASAQQVAAWLKPMCVVDAPWFERERNWGTWRYRVTRYGVTDVANKMARLRVLPTGEDF